VIHAAGRDRSERSESGDHVGEPWLELNQRALAAELARIRAALERHAGEPASAPTDPAPPAAARSSVLSAVAARFGLSPFERDILALTAGVELDASLASICALLGGDRRPTFGLALAALDGAHWSALVPAAPLRAWRLVEGAFDDGLTSAPLRIDERILHLLAGLDYLDSRLEAFVDLVTDSGGAPPSHAPLVGRLGELVEAADLDAPARVQLVGAGPSDAREIAAAACAARGQRLYRLRPDALAATAAEQRAAALLWDREALLVRGVLLVECPANRESRDTASRFCELVRGSVVISTHEPLSALERPARQLHLPSPSAPDRAALWRAALGSRAAALDGSLDRLDAHFEVGPAEIARAVAAADLDAPDPARALWDACRVQTRSALDDLAGRVEAAASWDDLVLPDRERGLLRQIAAQVQCRATVHERWGFGATGRCGLGIAALFCGPSGTGKTMAAEVLANDLRLDLYRIDLSGVVSKYIGETEKNLRRVFDAAERSGAILLFDEADALFGKRSEVRDSHDRYANVEISYLLQRMEAYRGLAILTTNLRDAIDAAFLRRFRFVIEFPFPDLEARADIWRRVFPPAVPLRGVALDRFAHLDISGGNIRNIALGAAFLAADAGRPVTTEHVERAVRDEYAKIERPLPDLEAVAWS
jgi:hypothetical protein